jgi:trk system potassium uptake protein TrkH
VNLAEVLHLVGALLVWVGAAMLPSTVIGAAEGELAGWLAASMLVAGTGAGMWFASPRKVELNPREALVVVGVGWLAVVVAGSVPFLTTGVLDNPVEALFESVAGFTTTGATVFPRVEDLPRSVLLWRSVTHWLGGMGIIVLGVAILPFLGMGGAQLFSAEAPGIKTDRLAPRIASTARLLWGVYALLTLLALSVYLILGMSLFDAVNHAMSVLATGGFSTHTSSLGHFSPGIQWVTVFFMLVAGTNFTLHYAVLTGRFGAWVRDAEWRWYVGIAAAATAIALAALSIARGGLDGEILRHAAFNVVAVLTSTGFATADFAAWPSVCQVMLLGLMFVGAMGGSTGGGFKVVRAVVVIQHTLGEIRKVLHPRAIFVPRLGGNPVKSDVVLNVMAFLGLYVATHGVGTILLAALGSDLVTATSAALSAMSSIGPGLGAVGPGSHYGDLSWASQLVLVGLMLLGRLEFYTVLVLFLPETWRRK